jgi:hypothetical protein
MTIPSARSLSAVQYAGLVVRQQDEELQTRCNRRTASAGAVSAVCAEVELTWWRWNASAADMLRSGILEKHVECWSL